MNVVGPGFRVEFFHFECKLSTLVLHPTEGVCHLFVFHYSRLRCCVVVCNNNNHLWWAWCCLFTQYWV